MSVAACAAFGASDWLWITSEIVSCISTCTMGMSGAWLNLSLCFRAAGVAWVLCCISSCTMGIPGAWLNFLCASGQQALPECRRAEFLLPRRAHEVRLRERGSYGPLHLHATLAIPPLLPWLPPGFAAAIGRPPTEPWVSGHVRS